MKHTEDWKILLIDDEKDIRDVITISLHDAGYEVLTAEDGEKGLELIRQASPQIVITDIRMPKLDGIQLLEKAKKSHPDTEIIVITAFGELEYAIKALQLGASDFITKPVNDEALHISIKRARKNFITARQLKEHTDLLERENARTAQELSQTILFQKNLIEGSMDGILGCDPDGRIVIFNKSMEQLLGFSRDHILRKKKLKDLISPEEMRDMMASLEQKGYGGKNRLLLYETTLIDSHSQQIPVQVSATMIHDQGIDNSLVFFFRDIRNIQRLEQEISDQAKILHQDKMMSLGRLAASVVHEINNPLFGILNYLKLMNKVMAQDSPDHAHKEKFKEYLDLAEKETDRCSKIISSLLTFSRKSPVSFEHIQISELLERCALLCRHKLELSNIELEWSVDPDIHPVFGDFNQLQQCLFNLIFNSIDAMPEGGTIYLRGYNSDRKVIISVKDSGPGIPEKDLPHIFEPFFTTKKERYGVGLGLSTVYGIIDKHKGKIRVESSQGRGTVFYIEFPPTST
ncbi:MAG: response regulator [Deltaproteobacteria bacterium]|nr:response regulator [Deltaproteobacteria bacterium]